MEDEMETQVAAHTQRIVPAPHGTVRTGGEIICDALKAHSVRTVFGYAGGAILHFYDALHRDPTLYHVTVRHEQGAAHAAAGYARASGRVGVCVSTSGPGATNLLTGIMDAHMDSTPMVVLCGQVDSKLIGNDAFQETDVLSITASVTKHGFQPRHVDELEEVVHAAFHIASTGRPGPVVIDVPKDVMMASTSRRAPRALPLPGYRTPTAPAAAAIDAAAERLRHAQRPVLLLGGGALIADAGAPLLTLAERFALPIVTTINAKGVIPESHPQAHGMIGMYGRKSGVWALAECDLLLAFGCRFTDRITGAVAPFARGKELVHIDVDAYELGKNVPTAIAIRADARAAAAALVQATAGWHASPAQQRWARQTSAARQICVRCVPHEVADGVHPKAVMDALNRVRRPQDIVTTGVGQHQMFASHFLVHERPRTFISSCGAGTMGFGLPAAIGAACAKRDARVFVVDGDGSFQMTAQELATVAQEELPIVMLVLDNQQLGMVRQWQDRVYDGRHAAVRFDDRPGHPDFCLLARAFGIAAAEVTTLAELEPALDAAVRCRGATLIRIAVDAAVDNLPMMPAGTDFSRFYGNCVARPGELFSDREAHAMTEAANG
jgi:acetolactate synthase-1/2/3 large subunit